jgi:hypothetical protein
MVPGSDRLRGAGAHAMYVLQASQMLNFFQDTLLTCVFRLQLTIQLRTTSLTERLVRLELRLRRRLDKLTRTTSSSSLQMVMTLRLASEAPNSRVARSSGTSTLLPVPGTLSNTNTTLQRCNCSRTGKEAQSPHPRRSNVCSRQRQRDYRSSRD